MALRDPWPQPAASSADLAGVSQVDPSPLETFYQTKRSAIDAFERDYFRRLVWRCKGNVSEMARQSGMKRHHVRTYLRRHGIDRLDPWARRAPGSTKRGDHAG